MSVVPSWISVWRRRRRALSRFPTAILHAGAVIEDDCVLGDYCVLFANVYLSGTSVGAFSYLQAGSVASNAEIGPFCSIGSAVTIGLAAHPTALVSTSPVFYDPAPPLPVSLTDVVQFTGGQPRTVIGADVWIGQGAMLKAGLRIGVGAVIGAGAVVTRDVAAYQIVGGNPARVIRSRFSADMVAQLVDSHWWDRDVSRLRQAASVIGDPTTFLSVLERSP